LKSLPLYIQVEFETLKKPRHISRRTIFLTEFWGTPQIRNGLVSDPDLSERPDKSRLGEALPSTVRILTHVDQCFHSLLFKSIYETRNATTLIPNSEKNPH
jgi:hypothetical protein